MDVLSDVLSAVRLSDAVFLDAGNHAPCSAKTEGMGPMASKPPAETKQVIALHAITRGDCWVAAADASLPPLHLAEGDIVVLPRPESYSLHDPNSPGLQGWTTANGNGAQVASAYLWYDASPFNPVLDGLPHFRVAKPYSSECLTLFRLAVSEAATTQTGRETILMRLAELLLMAALRRYIEAAPPEARSWFSGLRDPHIGAALKLMHERSQEDWSVDLLARQVGLSRSVFASRFLAFVGHSPIHYLTKCRIHRAAHLLEQPGAGVSEVAVTVGYDSDAAFCRSFKRVMGVPPGLWRRGARS